MKYLKAASAIDGYKASHKDQYPKGTDYVYSNLTPRHSKHFAYKDFDGLVVVFGNQSMVKFIHELWQDTFFSKPADEVVPALLRRLSNYSGHSDVEHFYALHKLGQLPVVIKSLAEGTNLVCQDIKNAEFPLIISNTEFFKRSDSKIFQEVLKYPVPSFAFTTRLVGVSVPE